MPFDLVPDFIPAAGYLDGAVIVAFVLRHVLRGSGPELIEEHWPVHARPLHSSFDLPATSERPRALPNSPRLRAEADSRSRGLEPRQSAPALGAPGSTVSSGSQPCG
jgi:uncharacterized membrane protein YkvA (DUF1232 family)